MLTLNRSLLYVLGLDTVSFHYLTVTDGSACGSRELAAQCPGGLMPAGP